MIDESKHHYCVNTQFYTEVSMPVLSLPWLQLIEIWLLPTSANVNALRWFSTGSLTIRLKIYDS